MILACDQYEQTVQVAWGENPGEVQVEEYEAQEEATHRVQELGKKAKRVVITQESSLAGELEGREMVVSRIPRLYAVYWGLQEQVKNESCLVLSIGQNSCVGGLVEEGYLVRQEAGSPDLALRGIWQGWLEGNLPLRRAVEAYLRGKDLSEAEREVFQGFLRALRGKRVQSPIPFSPPLKLPQVVKPLQEFLTQFDPRREMRTLILTDWAAYGSLPELLRGDYQVLCSGDNSLTDAVKGMVRFGWAGAEVGQKLAPVLTGDQEEREADAEALERKAKEAEGRGDRREAQELYQRLLEIDPDSLPALAFLGRELFAEGKNREAIPHLNALYEKDPKKEVWLWWLLAHVREENIDAYERDIERILSLQREIPEEGKPCAAEILRLAGKEYLERGRLDLAESYLRAAQGLAPSPETGQLLQRLEEEKSLTEVEEEEPRKKLPVGVGVKKRRGRFALLLSLCGLAGILLIGHFLWSEKEPSGPVVGPESPGGKEIRDLQDQIAQLQGKTGRKVADLGRAIGSLRARSAEVEGLQYRFTWFKGEAGEEIAGLEKTIESLRDRGASNEEVEGLQRQLTRFKEETDGEAAGLEKAIGPLRAIGAEVEGLQRQLTQFKEEAGEEIAGLEKAIGSLKAIGAEVEGLQRQLTRFKEETDGEAAGLEKAIGSLRAGSAEVEGLRDQLTRFKEETGEEIAGLEKGIGSLRARGASNEEVRGLQNQLAQFERKTGGEIADLEKTIGSLRARGAEVEGLQRQLTWFKEEAGEEIGGLEKTIESLRDRDASDEEIRGLQDQLAQLKGETGGKVADLGRAIGSLRARSAEVEGLQDQLSRFKEETGEEIGGLEEAIGSLRARGAEVEGLQRQLTRFKEETEGEVGGLEKAIGSLRAGSVEVEGLRDQLARFKGEIQNQLARLEKEIGTIKPPPPLPEGLPLGAYKTVRSTRLFREPREDASAVTWLHKGTKVNVVRVVKGKWLRVESRFDSPPGYLRREDVVPVRKEPESTRGEQQSSLEKAPSVPLPGTTGEVSSLTRQADAILKSVTPVSKEVAAAFTMSERSRLTSLERRLGRPQRFGMEALRGQGLQAHKQRRYQTAVEAYEALLTIDPDNFEALFNLAGAYYELNQPDTAIEYAIKAIKRSADPGMYFVVASAYVKKGDKERAFSWLEAAIKGGFTDRKMIEENFAAFQNDPVYHSLIQRLS